MFILKTNRTNQFDMFKSHPCNRLVLETLESYKPECFYYLNFFSEKLLTKRELDRFSCQATNSEHMLLFVIRVHGFNYFQFSHISPDRC